MPSARRTSSCGSDRRNNSARKPPRERPTTICVTFSKRERRRISATMSLPTSVLVSPPRASASFRAASTRCRAASLDAPARAFHVDRDPRRVHQVGQALGRAHDLRGIGVGPDAGEDALAGRQRPLDGLRLHALDQVGIDALGSAPQGQLAQRGKVLRLEEILLGARCRVLEIHLALGQALQKLFGGQVDQDDLVGILEHAVRHRLPHAHARDLLDHVVEALQMLDVQRGPHIDAGRQQLLDVLPALGVAAARDVGVGVLIDAEASSGRRASAASMSNSLMMRLT